MGVMAAAIENAYRVVAYQLPAIAGAGRGNVTIGDYPAFMSCGLAHVYGAPVKNIRLETDPLQYSGIRSEQIG
jgi:hypothetical protein